MQIENRPINRLFYSNQYEAFDGYTVKTGNIIIHYIF